MKKLKLDKVSRGVILMTVSNLTVKAAGLFFKIPMTSLIGEAGMGYFNSAYTLFTWLYMLSAAGLPTAASMLIARLPDDRRRRGAVKIFTTALAFFTLVGLISCVLLISCSDLLARLMKVEDCAPAIAAVAPTLFFICQSAALRGYFQGLGDLRPHSVSQLAEALGKLFIGVALAKYAVNSGKTVPVAAAYGAAGITVGVAAGMVVLYIAFIFSKKRGGQDFSEPRRKIATALIKATLPITLSSSVMSLTGLIDSFILTRSLHASGYSQTQTAAIWGNYSSLAVPMFNLPPVVTLPIAYALLPSLSAALASGDTKKAEKLTGEAVRSTLALAVPCAVGMSAMSKPLLSLLFNPDVAERGYMMLTLLAPSSVMLCMLGLINTVLQASGRERVPLYAMVCGAAVKIFATWQLTGIIGKYAAPVSTFLCYFTVVAIVCGAVSAYTPLKSSMSVIYYVKPIVFAALAVTAAVMLYPMTGTVISVAAAGAIYFGLVFICGRDVKYKDQLNI